MRRWRDLGTWLLSDFVGSKVDDINHQHDSDEACLKAVIEAFLIGKGHQPSWRKVIHVLHVAGESQIAHDIESFAEAVQGECM